jgi:hypothetical protein
MVALTTLQQTTWAGRLPNVTTDQVFWAKQADFQPLIDAGYAREWIEGTDGPLPPPEPAYTVHGSPGLAAGTTNASF